MKLLTRRSTFSFYEAFSDLIFCALVLFLLLILVLALSVDKRVEVVKAAEVEAEQQRQQIERELEATEKVKQELESTERKVEQQRQHVEQELKEINEKKSEAEKIRAQIAELESDVHSKKARLDRLLGTRRFTGRFGESHLIVAVDYGTPDPTYFVMPSDLVERFNLKVEGNNAEEETKRRSQILEDMRDALRKFGGLTIDEMKELFLGFSPYLTPTQGAEQSSPTFGVVTPLHGALNVLRVVYGSPAANAGLRKDDIVQEINDVPVADLDALREAIGSHSLHDTITVTYEREGRVNKSQVMLTPLKVRETNISLMVNMGGSQLASEVNGSVLSRAEMLKRYDAKHPNEYVLDSVTEDDQLRLDYSELDLLPTLLCSINSESKEIRIGTLTLSPEQFSLLLRSATGQGFAVEFTVENGEDLPKWVTDEVLVPTGFVNKAPILLQDDETGAGNLDAAVEANEAVATENAAPVSRLTPDDIRAGLAGTTWSHDAEHNKGTSWFRFNADGTVTPSWHNEPSMWAVLPDGSVQMIFTKNRGVQTMRVDASFRSGTGTGDSHWKYQRIR